ncbi:MAG TPA: LuxR C-terminal-related transcriptional regulator [Pyrinomonadaceae bacterium]|jgi:DNA-binding CsgD family transcriptional regulator
MFTPKNNRSAKVDSKTYPLGENAEHAYGNSMALLVLSHTPIEQRLYLAMLSASAGNGGEPKLFTSRTLLSLTGIRSLSTVRRGLEGLMIKLSVERHVASDSDGESRENGNGNGSRHNGHSYRVFTPDEILERRKALGHSSASVIESGHSNPSFDRALGRIIENRNLSRREAQVALCCVEGLTNAEIGQRLEVTEQTVKFHLRHVFLKFGVKRRAELISRLLM